MIPRLWVKELKPANIEGGYLIDGFPSVGFTSAIACESLLHTAKYDLVGFVDSSDFPTVAVIKDGIPNYATRIFANTDLKIGIFSSYLTISEPYHRSVAKTMLSWARKNKCSLIISSSPTTLPEGQEDKIVAVGSTQEARQKISDAGMTVLQHGTIPGIPGALLNEGMLNNQNVIVILIGIGGNASPDFKSSVNLCMAMAKLLPGASCDLAMIQKQAQIAQKEIIDTEKETRALRDSMYR